MLGIMAIMREFRTGPEANSALRKSHNLLSFHSSLRQQHLRSDVILLLAVSQTVSDDDDRGSYNLSTAPNGLPGH